MDLTIKWACKKNKVMFQKIKMGTLPMIETKMTDIVSKREELRDMEE